MSSVGTDEAAVQLGLRAALERLDAAPFAFLGLGADPTPAQARSAFLALTKQYHPTKFARFSPDTVRLANEVFLALKRVYESLERGARAGTARPAGSGSQPLGAVPRPAGTAQRPAVGPRRAAVHLRPTEPPATQPVPAVSTRIPAVSVRMRAADAPPAPAPTPAPTPTPTATPATTARIAQASPFVRIEGGAARPTAPSVSQPIPRADASSLRRNTPLRGVPQTGRTPRLERPADGSGSDVRAAVPASSATRIPRLSTGTSEEETFEQGLDLLRRRLWSDAEKIFAQLAITVPSDKRYRAHRHYARGRIAQDLGRHDDARSEWQRAIGLEPAFAAAKIALDQLPEPEPTKPQGLFGKIFRR
jgi:hypothetical protein